MVTNEERREVAAELRKKHGEQFGMFEPQDMGMQACNRLENLLDCLPERRDMFLVLADLIEPEPERTCKNNDGFCSECGQELVGYTKKISVDDEQNITITFAVQPYCYQCGAKVQS